MPEALGEAEAFKMLDADEDLSERLSAQPQSEARSLRRKQSSSSSIPSPGQAAVDLTPYRQQAFHLLEEWKKLPLADQPAMLAGLAALAEQLEALITVLHGSGAPAAIVKPLETLLNKLGQFLAGQEHATPGRPFWKRLRRLVLPPAAPEVTAAALWREAKQVLGAFSQSPGASSSSQATPAPERREFWK
jgi:hypothetical protein